MLLSIIFTDITHDDLLCLHVLDSRRIHLEIVVRVNNEYDKGKLCPG